MSTIPDITRDKINEILRKVYLDEAPTSPLLNSKRVRSAGMDATGVELENVYNELLPKFESIKSQFERLIKSAIPNYVKSGRGIKFLSALKPMNSLKNKVLERGKGVSNIGDIVRGALLLPSEEAVNDCVNSLKKRLGSMIVGYEFKSRGSDPTFGYYGSHHFDIQIDGLVTELQVMTTKLWNYKGAAHDIYNSNRTKISRGGSVSRRDSYDSKKIFSLGNRSNLRREDLDISEEWEYIEVELVE